VSDPGSDILIRPMQPEEAHAIASLYKQILMALPYYNERAIKELLRHHNVENLSKRASENPDAIIIALHKREYAGFCFNEDDSNTLRIDWIGISPPHRHKKIARHLIRHLESTAQDRDAHALWCDTHPENKGAIEFFRRQQFTPIGTVSNHWWDMDFIFWKKDLPRPAHHNQQNET
jgi:ribosomal protein S18 acetylase RimI-like enzyme